MDSSRWMTVWCWILVTISLGLLSINTGNATPIKIDFSNCRDGEYRSAVNPKALPKILKCCPPKPTKPIIDGVPPPSTSFVRVRRASQCTDEVYAAKLAKGYELMRALPDDDPRSLTQQWFLHCAYCGGSFISTTSDGANATGVDIHFSWLFYPWHRFFLFFHERILQSLLKDPTFSLNYWNWDSPYTGPSVQGSSQRFSCLEAGDNFPANLYGDVSASTYDTNRSQNAKGQGRLRFPDLTFTPFLTTVQQPLYNASAADVVASNTNVMYKALVSGGTTQATFLGRPYRDGSLKGNPSPTGGGGSLESSAHGSVHVWTGHDAPTTNDMGQLAFAARDPVFYAHHSNIDRLWEVWKFLGPYLGQVRADYSDPDYLNAEFLFYDENKDLRRVKVEDALDTKKLGYVYQRANDASWIFAKPPKCSNLSESQVIAEAGYFPVNIRDANGYYHLQAGTPFIIVIDRPSNPSGAEEFLTISGIKLDRMFNAGFDIFVNLVYPKNLAVPWKCAEYSGRFMNMATSNHSTNRGQELIWQQSITRTLVDIEVKEPPSKLVITLLPFTQFGDEETIIFSSINITT